MQTSLLRSLAALALSTPLFGQSLPAPSGALAVRAGENASTLFEVAEAYAERLGLALAVGGDAKAVLGRAKVGLIADASVPAEDVHAFAQSLLVLGGFVITAIEGELKVEAYTAEGRAAIAIEEAALDGLAGHEALLVRVRAQIEGVDARQLAASLRLLSASGLPAPNLMAREPNVLEIEGPAESVRRLVDVLRRCTRPAEHAAPADDLAALFPAPAADAGALTVAPKDTLLAVLERYVALTGRRLWVEERLRDELARTRCGLLGPVACDAARADALVESLLAAQGIDVTVRGSGAQAVHALQGSFRVAAVRPVLVDPATVDRAVLRDHPATVFGGVAELPGVEVRQLTTSLRTVLTDTQTQALMALADHTLYVQGGGASLAMIAAFFAELNGAAPRGAAAQLAGMAPTDGLSLRAQEPRVELSLRDLVEAWANATGRAILGGPNDFLLNRPLGVLELAIPATELDATVERRLVEQGFGLMPLCLDPPVCAVAGNGVSLRTTHRYVLADELEALAGHPAYEVLTLVTLEKLDARRAATWLRRDMDGTHERLIAVDGDRVLLGGPVERVRARIVELRGYDAAGELPETERGR